MTIDERKRIREYTFRELWDDLWIHHNCKIYKEGYIKAKRKYDNVKHRISYFIESTESNIQEPPWCFPKGKKNGYHEDSLKCALREFTEETQIDLDKIKVVYDESFTENFKGSNNKNYATHYYLAETKDDKLPKPLLIEGAIRKKSLSEEASEVKWFSVDEIFNLLNSDRQKIIKNILPIIEERLGYD